MGAGDGDKTIDEVIHRLSDTYGALSNAVRLQLLFELEGERKNVTTLAGNLGRSQESISRPLEIMRLENLLESQTEGRKRFYWIKKPEVLEQCKDFLELLQRDEDR